MQQVQSIQDTTGTSENWLLSLEDVDIKDSGWRAGESTVEMGGGRGGRPGDVGGREVGVVQLWENQNVSVKAGNSACRQSSHLDIHAPGLQT